MYENDELKSEAQDKNWQYSQKISRFKESQIVAGVVRNPRNLLWQTWVSLYGNDVTCLTAHRSRRAAEETIRHFCETYEAGKLLNSDAVERYVERMPTVKAPGALPQTTMEEIEHQIQSLFFGLRK